MTDAFSEPTSGEVVDAIVEGEEGSNEPDSPPTPESLGLELPDDPEMAISQLLVEIELARATADERLDNLKRVAADFENFRRRTQRDLAETTQRASEQVVTRLLPSLDSFDAAVSVQPSTETEANLLGGMLRTQEQLLTILNGLGLQIVPSVGEPFDPHVHEAVTSPSEGEGRLIVNQELRRGYQLNDRLIRPALVALEYEED